jgi:mannose-6-phosphate isomerase-like protein (cupin superfamily)
VFVHEDDRRKLIEFGSGTFKVCKVAIAKQNCALGDHHHRNKDEAFLLLSGHAERVLIGQQEWADVPAPFTWSVPRGSYHRFQLRAGSVLVGLATEDFDPTDEIPGRPSDG